MLAYSKPVFIDPTTDEGFKRLFGDKVNLINFLNIIFRGRKTITDLTYRDTERIGATEEIGKVIFDLVVQISTGEEIIIEMQTSTQTNLKQRMLYYASKVISDTAPKGNRKAWGYAIPEVYTIVLMDGFHMPGGDHKTYFHDTCLCNRDSGQIFYEGLGFIYMESRRELSFHQDILLMIN
ncbi:Rpn family recombination-promoting nuclease/putative transposase [Sphingobacterium sp. SG20118]|uniref:Rpn family recombination-promoting nuclease/putative transposase n=1 Tax=Sphingobacterium sp. SG20118 TaxID=3367156 RepID=UPI0037DFC120